MAAALDGLDALVFTAGIGENCPDVRARVCERLVFLGVEVDTAANERAVAEAGVATAEPSVRVIVVRAREELVAARVVRTVLARP